MPQSSRVERCPLTRLRLAGKVHQCRVKFAGSAAYLVDSASWAAAPAVFGYQHRCSETGRGTFIFVRRTAREKRSTRAYLTSG